MKKCKIVIDTNVIVSALKSRNGFSFKLLSMIDDERFKVAISVPVILEYEDVIKRNRTNIKLRKTEIDTVLDYICLVAEEREIFYLWRPFLDDPRDDMFLELAVESESNYIITFNKRDFKEIERFNIKVLTPKEFLRKIGEKV